MVTTNIYVISYPDGSFRSDNGPVDTVHLATEYQSDSTAAAAMKKLDLPDGSRIRRFIKTTCYCEVNEA